MFRVFSPSRCCKVQCEVHLSQRGHATARMSASAKLCKVDPSPPTLIRHHAITSDEVPPPLTKCRPTSRQVVGTLSVGAALYYLYDTYVVGKKVVSLAVLEASDDSTTNGIIAAFKNDATFVALAQAETSGILARDKEDGDKPS